MAEVNFHMAYPPPYLPYLVNMRRTNQPLHTLITKKVFDLEERRCMDISVLSVSESDQSSDIRLCLQWLQEAAESSRECQLPYHWDHLSAWRFATRLSRWEGQAGRRQPGRLELHRPLCGGVEGASAAQGSQSPAARRRRSRGSEHCRVRITGPYAKQTWQWQV